MDQRVDDQFPTGESAGALKNISVARRDFSTAQPLWAAVPGAMDSRMFTNDIHHSSGSAGVVNLGYRLANDPRSGALYSLFQRRINAGSGGSQNIDYLLNRSTDGGQTWELNGSLEGIVVASTQPLPKFCTVNATLGGPIKPRSIRKPATCSMFTANAIRQQATTGSPCGGFPTTRMEALRSDRKSSSPDK